MKKLKRFQTHSEYETYINGEGVILPNVSLCVNNDEVHYNPPLVDDQILIVKYNVTNANNPTYLYGFDETILATDFFYSVEIDGNIVSTTALDEAEGRYQLAVGEHTVRYGLNDFMISGNLFYNCTTISSVTIPNSIISIGGSAFYGCIGMKSITIPNSVTSILDSAFEYCMNIESVTIGNGLTSITDTAFNECYGIKSIVVKTGNTTYDSRDKCDAIIETATNTLVVGCKKTVIPNTVNKIGENAFKGCRNLSSITIPNSVTEIADGAFDGCSGFTTILTIPNSVMTIGEYAFQGCSGLPSVTIGTGITSIGGGAFSSCISLASVTVEATTPPTLGSDAFSTNASGRKIYVPSGSVSTYQSASGWITYYQFIQAIS